MLELHQKMRKLQQYFYENEKEKFLVLFSSFFLNPSLAAFLYN
ncbi:hypothetical protein RU97_GL002018 [Enterococcus canis]|uniref:Uncharacterized protein n=1 Tax=Enterococcus canis TaxID=214095 RepID=A0A1L8RFQ7_9ENTE|nr:hypothetical protein RU97_GL002018 [Enterococcus canis]